MLIIVLALNFHHMKTRSFTRSIIDNRTCTLCYIFNITDKHEWVVPRMRTPNLVDPDGWKLVKTEGWKVTNTYSCRHGKWLNLFLWRAGTFPTLHLLSNMHLTLGSQPLSTPQNLCRSVSNFDNSHVDHFHTLKFSYYMKYEVNSWVVPYCICTAIIQTTHYSEAPLG